MSFYLEMGSEKLFHLTHQENKECTDNFVPIGRKSCVATCTHVPQENTLLYTEPQNSNGLQSATTINVYQYQTNEVNYDSTI